MKVCVPMALFYASEALWLLATHMPTQELANKYIRMGLPDYVPRRERKTTTGLKGDIQMASDYSLRMCR